MSYCEPCAYGSDIFVVYKSTSSTLRVQNKQMTRLTLDVKGKDTIVTEKSSSDGKKKVDDTGWYYLGLVSQIGFSIALPIAGFAILGKIADGAWASSPKWTLVGLGTGIILSILTFVHTIQSVLRDKTK
jgi:hypothetical protein